MPLFGKKHVYSEFRVMREGFIIAGRKFPAVPGSPDQDKKCPVILCHGFTSSQKTTEDYAVQFAAWGYTAYTFDFVGGGPRNQSSGRMSDMSVMTERDDLFAVMDYVLKESGAEKVILMGCSQGGLVCAIASSQKPQLVDKLIMFYPALCIPDDAKSGRMMFFKFDPANVPEKVKFIGRLEISRAYVQEMQVFDPFASACLYPGDTLIVHGTKDKVVDINYSKCAYTSFCKNSGAAGKHFFVIRGGAHGFAPKHDALAVAAVEQFLEGYSEVVTVDVEVQRTTTEKTGKDKTRYIPFTGGASSRFFAGKIRPGAVDTWKWKDGKLVSCCASYTISGFDLEGQSCEITINNRSKDGKNWQPELSTDSRALDYLNHQQCRAIFEPRSGGPVIHIYAKTPQDL